MAETVVYDALLPDVKTALRVTKTNWDGEINSYILSAKTDLGIAGVQLPSEIDSIIKTAVITYVKMHFGQNDDYDRLKTSYDEQKAQLATATGYTNWG